MAKHITNCSHCGSLEFTVVETYAWRGDVDDSGVLACTKAEGGIDYIDCANCGKSTAVDRFARIDFN
jgi:transcription elongation factor Elf1